MSGSGRGFRHFDAVENDRVDGIRLLDPTQVPGALQRDDLGLRQTSGEVRGVLVRHHPVGGSVDDGDRLSDRVQSEALAKEDRARVELGPPRLNRGRGDSAAGRATPRTHRG